jgi:hypothetical protein
MRRCLPLIPLLLASLCPVPAHGEKLTEGERIELIRGLSAEYATAKVGLPRSKSALGVDTNGAYDRKVWDAAGRQFGPAARVGDTVQITAVDIQDDRIVFLINGGFNSGKGKWYQHAQISLGGLSTPVSKGNANSPGGTSVVLLFHKPVPPLKAAEIKKMLAPILDFEKRTATETFVESLPPEIKQAVKDKRVIEGMDREQVVAAVGKPVRKVREVQDGDEVEEWIYGAAPGKIVFVTFSGNKVIKVKEDYAGLGSEAPKLDPPR